jgi:hypothetical protein
LRDLFLVGLERYAHGSHDCPLFQHTFFLSIFILAWGRGYDRPHTSGDVLIMVDSEIARYTSQVFINMEEL